MKNDVTKVLTNFRRFSPPEERVVRWGDDAVTVLVYAEGERTYLDDYDRLRLAEDWGDPYWEPTVWRIAAARVEFDPEGRLEPGRAVRVKSFRNQYLGYDDNVAVYVKPRPGESFGSFRLLV